MSNKTEQQQFEKLIDKKVEKLNNPAELILELSRITFFQSKINEKLWHVNAEKLKEEANLKQSLSKQQEAESDSKDLDDKIDEYVTDHN